MILELNISNVPENLSWAFFKMLEVLQKCDWYLN